jgi:tRNA A-37 threonylcarbamoyl transferase component Bud32
MAKTSRDITLVKERKLSGWQRYLKIALFILGVAGAMFLIFLRLSSKTDEQLPAIRGVDDESLSPTEGIPIDLTAEGILSVAAHISDIAIKDESFVWGWPEFEKDVDAPDDSSLKTITDTIEESETQSSNTAIILKRAADIKTPDFGNKTIAAMRRGRGFLLEPRQQSLSLGNLDCSMSLFLGSLGTTLSGNPLFAGAGALACLPSVAADSSLTITNLNQTLSYVEETLVKFSDAVITTPSATVETTLTLSDTSAGTLLIATVGDVTSTYNSQTGIWQASGAVADVNTLLAGLQFVPAKDYSSDFTIGVVVDDGINQPFTVDISLQGKMQGAQGTEYQLNTYTYDNQGHPAMATLADGTILITWSSRPQDGSNYGIIGRLVSQDVTQIGEEFQINTKTEEIQMFSYVLVLNENEFLVVWSSNDGVWVRNVRSQRVSRIGQKIGLEEKLTDGFFLGIKPILLEDGGYVLGFVDSARYPRAYLTIYNADGSMRQELDIVAIDDPGVCDSLQLTLLNNGNFIATWKYVIDEQATYLSQAFDSNGGEIGAKKTWSSEITIWPLVKRFNDELMVKWVDTGDEVDPNYYVYLQRFDQNLEPIATKLQLNTYMSGYKGICDITQLQNGDYIVVWMSYGQEGSHWELYGRRLNSNYEIISDEFHINAFTRGWQQRAVIEPLADGGFLVIWESCNSWTSDLAQDGSQGGIYAQRYDAIGNKIPFDYVKVVLDEDSVVNIVIPEHSDGTIVAVSNGQHGSVSMENNQFIYTPDSDYSGSDYFVYTLKDASDKLTYKTISIEVTPVNDIDDTTSFPWDVVLIIALGLLAGGCSCVLFLQIFKRCTKGRIKKLDVNTKKIEMQPIAGGGEKHKDQAVDITIKGSSIATEATLEEEPEQQIQPPLVEAYSVSYTIPYEALTFGDKLGGGSYGVVYQGKWRSNTDVAIKQLHSSRLTQTAIESFQQEAGIMAHLRHPNIVQFYGISVDNPGHYCLVMELMPQCSLFDVIHNGQPLEWKVRYSIASDIAKGLSLLHDRRVIHQDLKSPNVLIGDGMRAKITDFGLAQVKTETSTLALTMPQRTQATTEQAAKPAGTLRWMAPELFCCLFRRRAKATDKSDIHKQTSIGQAKPAGTLRWMAPELFRRRAKPTTQSDIHSYGMILWELASRLIPFADAASDATIERWISEGVQETIPEDCPTSFAALITKCWKERTERPTADEAVTDLKEIQQQEAAKGPQYKIFSE